MTIRLREQLAEAEGWSPITYPAMVAYLESHGWTKQGGGDFADLWWRPENHGRRVLVPKLREAVDYERRIGELLSDLHHFEGRTLLEINVELERLEPTGTFPVSAEDAPQCAFHAQNPASGKLGQCVRPAEVTVIVAATMPGGSFKGDGVETRVCASHGNTLVEAYGAVLVPVED